jgi:hypothetical protein
MRGELVKLFLQLSELGLPPPPHPRAIVPPPPLDPGGRGRGEGMGGSQFRDILWGTLYIDVLCGVGYKGRRQKNADSANVN